MQKPDLHLCIDRVVPLEHKVKAAELARKENRKNEPRRPPLLFGASIHPVKMALLTGKKWQPGKTLSVAFLDGSKTQRAKVIEKAKEWSSYANISFFLPVLLVRSVMRWLGLRAATEYGINISLMNGPFSQLFAAERFILERGRIPFGVSAVCIARRVE